MEFGFMQSAHLVYKGTDAVTTIPQYTASNGCQFGSELFQVLRGNASSPRRRSDISSVALISGGKCPVSSVVTVSMDWMRPAANSTDVNRTAEFRFLFFLLALSWISFSSTVCDNSISL